MGGCCSFSSAVDAVVPQDKRVSSGCRPDPYRDNAVCSSCDKSLKNDAGEYECVMVEGKPWCCACVTRAERSALPTCRKCAQPVHDSGVQACGAVFHKDCFRCCQCEKVLSESYIEQEDNTPQCKLCYEKETQMLKDKANADRPECARCASIIEGKVVTFNGTKLHPGCFVCSRCGAVLKSEFANVNDLPVCLSCAL